MVGELAARYVTVKYTDFLQHNQGYTSRCVCVEGGGGGGGGGVEGLGGGGGLHPGVLFLDSMN